MERGGVVGDGLAQLGQAKVVGVKGLASADRLDGRLADEVRSDFIALAEPEGQDVLAAEAGIGDFADLGGFEVLDGGAHGARAYPPRFILQLVGISASAGDSVRITRKP